MNEYRTEKKVETAYPESEHAENEHAEYRYVEKENNGAEPVENDSKTAESAKKARRRFPVGLQVRFQIALGLVFLLFCFLTAWLIYSREKRLVEENALAKSRIVLAAVESTRSYVRDILRPKMYEVAGKDAFVLEAMSTSYITRAVMERFNESLPDYKYRRVAIKARNPRSEPTVVEKEMIGYFRENPDLRSWQGIREIDGAVGFLHARPVYMKRSCLNCHGKPEAAPQALIETYGDERGFGYTEQELAGITAVSIPVQSAMAKVRSQALSVFWASLMGLMLMYILISFLFNRMVVRSLRDLLGIFRRGLMDEEEIALLTEASRKDEISELSDSARLLADRLKTARRKLALHAENLKRRVAERTRDLEISRANLREKVEARNRELETLNRIAELITQSFRLDDILPGVLEQTLGLIPARGAAIFLLSGDGRNPTMEMRYQRGAEKLAKTVFREEAGKGGDAFDSLEQSIWAAATGRTTRFTCKRNQSCLNVPLVCRERILGVMTFVGVDFGETSPEMGSLLMSVGRQIGAAIDSLENMSALFHSKELLQSVFDGIPDMMVLLGRDLEIRMVNRAYLKEHGEKLEDVLGRRCQALEGNCDCPFAGERLSRVLAEKRQSMEEISTESGQIFMVYYYPILDEGGEIWGILRYAKDITLEKQVERRIQQTEKLAAMGQLAAGVAHEINNPMGIILCYTDLLKRQLNEPGQAVEDVKVVEKQARNCQRIVSDLLEFSRSGKTAPRPADINEALRQVVEIVKRQFEKSGTEIELDLSEAMPVACFDVDKMKQVFLNLLINANQAISKAGGKIRARTVFRPEENIVEIGIKDNGSGIAPEIVKKIFDPFFSTKQTGEGTGLGLSVSYGIVKDHGGELTVATEPEKWTEFTIQLPLRSS